MRYFYQSIYQDTVDALREIFNRLNLIIDGIACVRIADPEILRILKEKLDVDNIGAISEEYIKNTVFHYQCSGSKQTSQSRHSMNLD